MKNLFSLLLFLLIHFKAHSDYQKIKDSLYRELKNVSKDKKSKLLYEIAQAHFALNEFSETKTNVQNSLKLINDHLHDDYKILNLSLLAETYRLENNLDDALSTIMIASKLNTLKNKEAEIQRNLIFSYVLSDMKMYETSIKYLKRNFQLLKQKESNQEKFKVMTEIGKCYIKLKKYPIALNYLKKALIYKNKEWKKIKTIIPQKDDLTNIHVYNNLGFIYLCLNRNDLALVNYKLALKMLNKIGHNNRNKIILEGCIHGNIGFVLAKTEKFSEALPFLMKDFNVAQKYGLRFEKSHVALTNAEVYYIPLKIWDKAEKLINLALHESSENTIKNNQLKALKLFSELYKKKGNLLQSSQYLYRYVSCMDSIDEKQKIINYEFSGKIAQLKIDRINNKLSIQKLTRKNAKNNFYLALGIGFFCCFFIFYFIKKKIKDQKKKLELNGVKNKLAEAKIEIQQKEIDFKNKEMENLALNIIEKNNFLEHIKRDLKNVSLEPNVKLKIREISSSINQKLTAELNRDEFEMKLDHFHQSFFLKLKTEHPDITENEKRLCTLLCLKFSSKEIAVILNISIAGVNKNRQRLRKKLEIDSQVDLIEWFDIEFKAFMEN